MLGLLGLDDLDAYHVSAELAFLLKVQFLGARGRGKAESPR